MGEQLSPPEGRYRGAMVLAAETVAIVSLVIAGLSLGLSAFLAIRQMRRKVEVICRHTFTFQPEAFGLDRFLTLRAVNTGFQTIGGGEGVASVCWLIPSSRPSSGISAQMEQKAVRNG